MRKVFLVSIGMGLTHKMNKIEIVPDARDLLDSIDPEEVLDLATLQKMLSQAIIRSGMPYRQNTAKHCAYLNAWLPFVVYLQVNMTTMPLGKIFDIDYVSALLRRTQRSVGAEYQAILPLRDFVLDAIPGFDPDREEQSSVCKEQMLFGFARMVEYTRDKFQPVKLELLGEHNVSSVSWRLLQTHASRHGRGAEIYMDQNRMVYRRDRYTGGLLYLDGILDADGVMSWDIG